MELDTPENRAALTLLRGSRIRAGMDRRRAAGGIVAPLPHGYRRSSYMPDARIEVDPEAAATVLETFHLADHGYSVRAITAELARLGLLGRKGRPLSVPAVYGILRNSYYLGVDTDVLTGETFAGGHPALIVDKLWESVQAKLQARNRRGSYRRPF
jgi:hypothetical protein